MAGNVASETPAFTELSLEKIITAETFGHFRKLQLVDGRAVWTGPRKDSCYSLGDQNSTADSWGTLGQREASSPGSCNR